MCIPLVAIGAIAAIAGAGVSGYGAVSSGNAQKDAANYNAKVQNAQALNAEQAGADAGAQQREKARKLASTQTAMAAGGGLDTTSGTVGDIINETTKYGELDALRITNNAARTAWGYQAQAGLDTFQGDQAQTAGYLSAGSSILGGASSAFFGMQKFKGA